MLYRVYSGRRRRRETAVDARHQCAATLVTARHDGARVHVARARSVLLVAFHRQSVLGQKLVQVAVLRGQHEKKNVNATAYGTLHYNDIIVILCA